jgi:hypothetical protein
MPPWIKIPSYTDERIILSAHTIEAVGTHMLSIWAKAEGLTNEQANFTIEVIDNDYPVYEKPVLDTRLQLGDKVNYTFPRIVNPSGYNLTLEVDESTIPNFMTFVRLGNTTEDSQYFFQMAPTVELQNKGNLIKSHFVCVEAIVEHVLDSYEPKTCIEVEVYDWPENVDFVVDTEKSTFKEIYVQFNESVSFPGKFEETWPEYIDLTMHGGAYQLDFGFEYDLIYFSNRVLIFKIELGDLSLYNYYSSDEYISINLLTRYDIILIKAPGVLAKTKESYIIAPELNDKDFYIKTHEWVSLVVTLMLVPCFIAFSVLAFRDGNGLWYIFNILCQFQVI